MDLIYRETELEVKGIGSGMISLPKYGISVSIDFLSDAECAEKHLTTYGLSNAELQMLIKFFAAKGEKNEMV